MPDKNADTKTKVILIILFALLFPFLLEALLALDAGSRTDLHRLAPFFKWVDSHFWGNITIFAKLLVYELPGIFALLFLPYSKVLRTLIILGYLIIIGPLLLVWAVIMACLNGTCL